MLKAPFVILDNHRDGGKATLYQHPDRIISCRSIPQVAGALIELQRAVDEGFHVAGYFSYELGYALEEKLHGLMPTFDQPLLWFGAFTEKEDFTKWPQANPIGITGLNPAINFTAYKKAFDRVQRYLRDGDMYQVNLTFPYRFHFSGDPLALYAALRSQQHVAHGAYIDNGTRQVLSLSPELFLRIENGQIIGKPMKGTAARGVTAVADQAAAKTLALDMKNRAENLMIVDLMRNDFGRLAATGQVRVPELFVVESYETLHQMRSTVEATLKKDVNVAELLKAVFPCGSITGAPKIRAMQIIRELEHIPRGVYTGAIGVMSKHHTEFNVAIRTLEIEAHEGRMGVGGGIVADSSATAEYDEALLKARFLTDLAKPFALFETMRLEKNKIYLLKRHMARLKASAKRFDFAFDEHECLAALEKLKGDMQRVKITVQPDGSFTLETAPLKLNEHPWQFIISDTRLNADDIFLRHKTTRRELYERELAAAKEQGADEVFFVNMRGELCEGSFTNLFLELDGVLYTPPVACGLLPGTLRAELLAKGKAKERILTPADLGPATAIYAGNSVRGLVLATPCK